MCNTLRMSSLVPATGEPPPGGADAASSRKGTPPLFVKAQLQQREPPVLELEYAAHASLNSDQTPTGQDLILSLIKRLHDDAGGAFRPPKILARFPASHGVALDSNYGLLVEAMATFGLSVERAIECSHLAGALADLGYYNISVTLYPGQCAACVFEPGNETHSVRFGPYRP